MSTRRAALSGLALTQLSEANAGLLLDRLLVSQEKESKENPVRRDLLKAAAQLGEPPAYWAFFARWAQSLASSGAQLYRATCRGRLIVGLGDESVLETAITLHHSYAVPVIPGSALKGLAAAYARQRLVGEQWQVCGRRIDGDYGPAYQDVFGSTADAGFVTFFDALPFPGSGVKGQLLHLDVLTVHHPDYYEGKGTAPADWDSPNPVPFLSATGDYLVALAMPGLGDGWPEQIAELLRLALDEYGVGAKTSSGYGRMNLDKAVLDATRLISALPQPKEVRRSPLACVPAAAGTARAQTQTRAVPPAVPVVAPLPTASLAVPVVAALPAVSAIVPPPAAATDIIGAVRSVRAPERDAQVADKNGLLLKFRPGIQADLPLPKVGDRVRVERQPDGEYLIVEIIR